MDRPPPPTIHFHKLDPRAKAPTKFNEFAIGWDVYAFLLTESGRATSRQLNQRATTAVPTGLVVWPSEGYYIEVHGRSLLGKKGIMIGSAVGIIDPDYSGDLDIMLYNGGYETHYVAHEHRIAQLILKPATSSTLREEPERPAPFGRGPNGFGVSGL
jgi:deoxyuridine 5'-triphosphate nucleotidohydrolase